VQPLSKRIQAANTLLAPYAVPHEGILGRVYPEAPDETRFLFQRDRDRIIHTQAFRRLKGKTQVFVAGTHGSTQLTTSDHVRTRLTHTMEVAQISRDIARALSLNEDLAEAIALSHDLGHPPFGHAGEEALNRWIKKHGAPSVVEGFEHNMQSHRVVTVLAEHSTQFPGLNLNQEILEGILKHRTQHVSDAAESRDSPLREATLEAQVVNLADEIAYTGHDCEDGIHTGLFLVKDIMEIPLVARASDLAAPRGTSLRGAIIHILVSDLLLTTEQMITDHGVRSLNQVQKCPATLSCFSEATTTQLSALRDFLWKHMYLHPDVLMRSRKGQLIIEQLCDQYMISPPDKVIELQKRTGSALVEAVKDYIAGMTDGYAAALVS
jgi:dGTPase